MISTRAKKFGERPNSLIPLSKESVILTLLPVSQNHHANYPSQLVNTTVSQSVPPAVILAVKSVTKQFAGILVEMARQVQAEWIAAGEEQADVPHPQFRSSDTQMMILADTTPPDFRGPLRPDHLREAWRRYKVSGEGGGVGSHTFWHAQQGSGSSRFSRTGKRLFQ